MDLASEENIVKNHAMKAILAVTAVTNVIVWMGPHLSATRLTELAFVKPVGRACDAKLPARTDSTERIASCLVIVMKTDHAIRKLAHVLVRWVTNKRTVKRLAIMAFSVRAVSKRVLQGLMVSIFNV